MVFVRECLYKRYLAMSYKWARLAFAFLIAFSLTNAGLAGQDDSSKSKKKPKNSDVDNIGSRDINKGNILPLMSYERRSRSANSWPLKSSVRPRSSRTPRSMNM